MSREWGREAFVVDPDALGRHMAEQRGGFAARAAVTWMKPEDFARGSAGFEGTAPIRPQGFTPSGNPAPHGHEFAAAEALTPEVPPTSAIDAAEAYAAGFAEGERIAHIAQSADRAAAAKLLASLSGGAVLDRPTFARRLQQTVLHLVTQLIGEHGVSPEKLGQRIDHAVGLLADATEPARLYLHPEDVSLLREALPANIATVADKAIERGGFRLETLSAAIEDGPTIWLEQLSAALNRTAIPDA